MKALVLSGGHGTRLRPITHTSAKQLVPIANKPVLFYGLESLRDAGVEEAGIVIGDTGPEIRSAVGDGSAFGMRVTYIPQQRPLGLAHAVLISRDYLRDDDFIMYLGDNFIVGGIGGTVDEFRACRPDAQLLLTKVADPSQFGIAEIDAGGRVITLTEKPARPRSDLAIVGVYLFTPAIHAAVRSIAPSSRGELEITDAISKMLGDGADIAARVITGYWKDTGRVEDMLECNRLVLESVVPAVAGDVDGESEIVGRVVIGEGARVRASRLVGPLIIGAGATVGNSYVGPFTSIGPGCVLRDTEIEFSIVMTGSSLTGVRRVAGSLIGKNATVAPATDVPRAHQLVIGDHSEVRIVR